MKEENTNEQSPLTKDNLPEVMYPGVPVEYSGKELAAEGETTQEEAFPELTEEEKEEQQKESDKESTALIVFIVLFALMILKFFFPILESGVKTEELAAKGIDEHLYLSVRSFLIYIGATGSCLLPVLFVRFAIMKKGIKTVSKSCSTVIYSFWGLMCLAFWGLEWGHIFIPLWTLTVLFTVSLLSYNGGGIFKHMVLVIKEFIKKSS